MWQWMKNVWFLSRKELRSLLGDYTLMVLIVVVLSVAVYTVSTGITTKSVIHQLPFSTMPTIRSYRIKYGMPYSSRILKRQYWNNGKISTSR